LYFTSISELKKKSIIERSIFIFGIDRQTHQTIVVTSADQDVWWQAIIFDK